MAKRAKLEEKIELPADDGSAPAERHFEAPSPHISEVHLPSGPAAVIKGIISLAKHALADIEALVRAGFREIYPDHHPAPEQPEQPEGEGGSEAPEEPQEPELPAAE